MAAALGAAQKFIGEREFDRLVYPEGLPYAFRFHGLDGNADDATVVIAGDLGSSFADYSRYAAVRPLSEVRGKARRAAELDALKPGTPQWEEAKREAVRRLPFFRIGDDNLIAEWKGLLKQPWGFEGVTFRFPASPALTPCTTGTATRSRRRAADMCSTSAMSATSCGRCAPEEPPRWTTRSGRDSWRE